LEKKPQPQKIVDEWKAKNKTMIRIYEWKWFPSFVHRGTESKMTFADGKTKKSVPPFWPQVFFGIALQRTPALSSEGSLKPN
jgi:hypothetical protein